MFARGALDALADQLRPDAVAFPAAEEVRIIVAPAANVLHHMQHLRGAVGMMRVEPGAEQRRDHERQADQDLRRTDCTGHGGGGYETPYLEGKSRVGGKDGE